MGRLFSFPVTLLHTLSSKLRWADSKLGTLRGTAKDMSVSWSACVVAVTACLVEASACDECCAVFAAANWRTAKAEGAASKALLRRLNGSRVAFMDALR
jgi:hypothetical protein